MIWPRDYDDACRRIATGDPTNRDRFDARRERVYRAARSRHHSLSHQAYDAFEDAHPNEFDTIASRVAYRRNLIKIAEDLVLFRLARHHALRT